MAGVASFQIKVPRKTVAAGLMPIIKMRVVVSLESEPIAGSPVTFEISDPRDPSVVRIFGPFPGGSTDLVAFDPIPPEATAFDAVQITVPDAGCLAKPADDPCRRRYAFNFDLDSDYDLADNCETTWPGGVTEEIWTISVTSGPNITSACLTSFDRNIPGLECVGGLRVVPLSEAVAELDGFPDPDQFCGEWRPPLDAVLVLDKSGSMNGSTLGGAPEPKITALRNAVTDFVTIWDELRTTEVDDPPIIDPPPPVRDDNIGVVLFDGNADWWSALAPELNSFAAAKQDILDNVAGISAGGTTSIGDGMLLADGALEVVDATRRRAILLMSNGKQNTDQMIAVQGGQVVTHPKSDPDDTTPLPNQANYQVYSVTVGTSTAVSPQINMDLADATGGFYINSEDDAGLMSPFFLELLQNFIKFNTWETHRLIHGEVALRKPYSFRMPFSTTTRHVVMSLRWPAQMGVMRLQVLPSGENQPVESQGQGSIVLKFNVPTSSDYNFTDEWAIGVEVVRPAGPGEAGIPFDLVVLGDDAALDSEMSIVPQAYVPGDHIQLEARITELGRPVLNLGGQPGDRMVVQVVKPGVGIGDLLSDSTAPTAQPFADDAMTDADAKLHNELQENPEGLVRDDSDTITLAEVGDGVYRGTYWVQKPGHYDFLFGLEGTTENTGRFSRMQLKTVYVRPAPDADTTVVKTDIKRVEEVNQLVIDLTPRTKYEDKLGPGWANYFWFTAPGRRPVKAWDNLDGTYTVRMNYTGLLPPTVSLHFLDVSMVIDDSVQHDKLPVPLDDSTMLFKRLPGTGCLALLLSLLKRIFG
jgi:hypothetical protein